MSSYAVEGDSVRSSRSQEPIGSRVSTGLYLAVGSGELRLTSADPDQQRFLDYRYFQDEFDLRRVREGVRLSLELAEHPSLRELIQERVSPTDAELASEETLDEFILRTASTGQHISGTCKMGPASDPMAVVDQYGKVHGIENLRVADASIMPDCIRANTKVTTMMIGERVADFIRRGA